MCKVTAEFMNGKNATYQILKSSSSKRIEELINETDSGRNWGSTQARSSVSRKEKMSRVNTTPNKKKINSPESSEFRLSSSKLIEGEISCPNNEEPPKKKTKKGNPNYIRSANPATVRKESLCPILGKLEEEILCCDAGQQEDPSHYSVGGFHPVAISDLFHDRYYVLCKLGWGTFSTVWLCWDLIGIRFVALKIVKSNYLDTKSALNEIMFLRSIGKRKKLVQLLDDFKVSGINGTHICMVFEVLGHSILKFISTPKLGIPLPTVKTIIRQVCNKFLSRFYSGVMRFILLGFGRFE